MPITIGGDITIQIVESISIDSSRRNTVLDIPYGSQLGFSSGVNLRRFQLECVFLGDTVAEAKAMRQRLHNLVENYQLDPVYIAFDPDDEEMSGYFLIDSQSTSIQPPFGTEFRTSLSVQRLSSKSANLLPAIYWRSIPLTKTWSGSPRTWVTIPDNTDVPSTTRTGAGDTEMVFDPASNPLILFGTTDPSFSSNCYWTGTPGGTEPPTGDTMYFHNGLIQVKYNASAKSIDFQVYNNAGDAVGRPWLTVINNLAFSDAPLASGSVNIFFTAGKPYIVKNLPARIEWRQLYTNDSFDYYFEVTHILRRGAYFLETTVRCSDASKQIGHYGGRGDGEFLDEYNSSTDKWFITTQDFDSVLGFDTWHALGGYLLTEGSVSTYLAQFRHSHTASAGDNYTFALIGRPYPSGLPEPPTVGDLQPYFDNDAEDFIAGMYQQLVLVEV